METTIETGSSPNLKELVSEFQQVFETGGLDRLSACEDRRLMRWAGQSEDGRKWSEANNGDRVLPWDGASDTRVPMIDEICNDSTGVRKAAFNRAKIQVAGVEFGDLEAAGAVRTALHWLTRGKLRRALKDEIELSSQYIDEYGWCLVYVGWDREITMERQVVTMDDLRQMAAPRQDSNGSMQPLVRALIEAIMDPSQEDSAVDLVQQMFREYVAKLTSGVHQVELPDIKRAAARRMVRELRASGETTVAVPGVTANQPLALALKPYTEAVLAVGSVDVKSARAIFWRQLLTEADLRAQGLAEGWNTEWIEAVVKTKGATIDYPMAGTIEDALEQIEIIYAYTRKVDEDNVPAIWCTIFSPHVTAGPDGNDLFAKHEALDYGHGRYPFVAMRRELRSRAIQDSRPVSDIVFTWQSEEKNQRDALFNRAQWDTFPPLLVPRLMGVDLKVGPGAVLNRVRAGELSFVESPNRPPALAIDLIAMLERRVNNYFGRPSNDVPPYRSQVLQESMVDRFLETWTDVIVLMLALQIQYDPATLAQVCGRPWPRALTPRRIMDQIDVMLAVDVKEINPDYLLQKMEIVSKSVLPEDAAGIIDRAKLTKAKLAWLDPALAEELVMDQQGASQQLFRQVHQDVALMALGNEAEYVENDPTAPSKLKFLQDIVGRNPKYQQALQADDRFMQLLGNYEANLKQSMAQEQNKAIGRIGVKPVGAS